MPKQLFAQIVQNSEAIAKATGQFNKFSSACLGTVGMYFSVLPTLHNSVIVLFDFPSVT